VIARRFVVFGGLWVVLTLGDLRSWGLALAIVVLAVVSSLRLAPPGEPTVRWLGVLRFAPFFLLLSLRGGVDVALRALRPGPPIDPVMLRFTSRLPAQRARILFTAAAGLFPGTLGASLAGGEVLIHVLHRGMGADAQLRSLEERIADIFGLSLESDGAGGAPPAP
jgi:multicomponent Na+:H+ antiporter subunit E